jgi:hypothetical protein
VVRAGNFWHFDDMYLLTKSRAQELLADAIRLTVTPHLVAKYAFPPAYRLTKRVRGLSVVGPLLSLPLRAWGSLLSPPGDWDSRTSLFRDHPTFRRVLDLEQHVDDFRASGWYRDALDELHATGRFRYKKRYMTSVTAIDDFFTDYLVGLIVSMRNTGYRTDAADDRPGVMIDRNGALVKSPGGRHRWAVATLLELDRVPVQIEHIHPVWLKHIQGGFSGMPLERLRDALQKVQATYSV